MSATYDITFYHYALLNNSCVMILLNKKKKGYSNIYKVPGILPDFE